MNLDLVEPLRMLFKDEVRGVGKSLGMDPLLLGCLLYTSDAADE